MNEKVITKKDMRDLMIVLVLIGITWYVMRKAIDIETLKMLMSGMMWRYLFLSIGLLFLFWGLEALMMGWLIHRVNLKIERRRLPWIALKTTLIGQYYANITPFASGGQPVQLYILKQHKLSTSEGTAVLMSKFLIFQITVTLYALFLFIRSFQTTPIALRPFVITGLVINLIGLAIIAFSAFKPQVLFGPIDWSIRKFQRSKTRMQKLRTRTHQFVNDYQTGMARLTSDYRETATLFLLSLIQLTAFFSMPYFLSKAMGIPNTHFLQMLTIQAELYMCISFIPIPGTVGVSEFGFVALMGNVMSGNLASMLMVLWRLVSYYFSLIFCGAFSLITSLMKRVKPSEIP
ncbi:MAG: hypothetical protein PWP38_856 [Clostridiales bacterium]|nr:hypothetical protein [Clostridiales bacterium]